MLLFALTIPFFNCARERKSLRISVRFFTEELIRPKCFNLFSCCPVSVYISIKEALERMVDNGVRNSCEVIETKLDFISFNSFSRLSDSVSSKVRSFTFPAPRFLFRLFLSGFLSFFLKLMDLQHDHEHHNFSKNLLSICIRKAPHQHH